MAIGVVINPISGRSGAHAAAGLRRADRARALAAAAGVDAEIAITRARGHGAEIAAAFARRGMDTVIAWGGDGTINEVAGPLIGTTTALGIVPSGSGDGLALSLGVPLAVDRAFAAAIDAPAVAMDVGYVGDRHFLNVAGIGFDATVARAFNQRLKRGALGYVLQCLRGLWSYTPRRYEVRLDERVADGSWFLVAFANGREYGNRLVLAADADMHDGWLNAVVVDAGSSLATAWRARRLALRAHRPAAGIHRSLVKTARVSGDHLLYHLDGETFETSGAIDVTIRPAALLVRRPIARVRTVPAPTRAGAR